MFTYFALDGQTALYWDYNCVNPVFTTAGAGFSSSQQTYDTQASVSYQQDAHVKHPQLDSVWNCYPWSTQEMLLHLSTVAHIMTVPLHHNFTAVRHRDVNSFMKLANN